MPDLNIRPREISSLVDLDHIERDLRQTPEKPAFVNIFGASASGKSTIARCIAENLTDTSVLAIDSYLAEGLWDSTRKFNHDSPDLSRPYIGGISPEIWDLSLLKDHVAQLAVGHSVQIPRFDETIKDRVGYELLNPGRAIVLEGGHSFLEPFVSYAAHKIYVRASLHDRLMRKIIRTHIQYQSDDVNEVLERYLTRDEYAHRAYALEFEQRADQVIENPAHPRSNYQGIYARSTSDARAHMRLMPAERTGILQAGEQLVITQSGADYGIRYSIDDRTLVDLPITLTTKDLMMQHYERV